MSHGDPGDEVTLSEYLAQKREQKERDRWDTGEMPNPFKLNDVASFIKYADDADQAIFAAIVAGIALALLIVCTFMLALTALAIVAPWALALFILMVCVTIVAVGIWQR